MCGSAMMLMKMLQNATAPGIGMPMCLLSGEHAATAALEEYPTLTTDAAAAD